MFIRNSPEKRVRGRIHAHIAVRGGGQRGGVGGGEQKGEAERGDERPEQRGVERRGKRGEGKAAIRAVPYTHLTLPTNREV